MINANELRIGNLVYRDSWNDSRSIDIITGYDFWHSQRLDRVESQVEWGSLSVIPLTEEILLKCGFEKLGGDNYSIGRISLGLNYNISIDIDYVPIHCLNGKIKYLHQLQNLYFALTNEELEITL
jgi:hypothetical protein